MSECCLSVWEVLPVLVLWEFRDSEDDRVSRREVELDWEWSAIRITTRSIIVPNSIEPNVSMISTAFSVLNSEIWCQSEFLVLLTGIMNIMDIGSSFRRWVKQFCETRTIIHESGVQQNYQQSRIQTKYFLFLFLQNVPTPIHSRNTIFIRVFKIETINITTIFLDNNTKRWCSSTRRMNTFFDFSLSKPKEWTTKD